MKNPMDTINRRILLIDDNHSIHADFRKILIPQKAGESKLDELEENLFGGNSKERLAVPFEVDSAWQGPEGLVLVEKALAEGRPYAMAFVDMRMPPGWDGLETISRIWVVDRDIQVVICTAYSDYSWEEMLTKLGHSDRLVILKKPFGNIEVQQLAYAMTEKWGLLQKARARMDELEQMVRARTASLEEEIRERKRAETVLGAAQTRFQAVWENAGDGMVLTDEAGTVVAVNEAFCKLVELKRENLENQTFPKIYSESNRGEEPRHDYQRRFNARSFEKVECREVAFHNQKEAFIEVTNSFVEPKNQHALLLQIFRDVTERCRLEEQLRQAQKMECVGRLAGGVAHDFNNLLTVIGGHAALLCAPADLGADPKESAMEICRAAERATNLTRQLLTFSRKQVFRPHDVNLSQIVLDLSKMLQRTLGEDIALQVECGADLPVVNADQTMMEQVLLNLAVNSRDAMPKGGCLLLRTDEVTYDCAPLHESPEACSGRFVRLSVRDTGCGIPRELLPHLFEPFFTTKETGKGTGLGLATVYGIVKQHGGWVTIESKLNEGTTIRVMLPGVVVSKPSPEKVIAETRPKTGCEVILVVEDEASVRMLVAGLLKRYGYKVLEASTGKDALGVWQNHRAQINLLLTDLIMPDGMTGLELATVLQAENPRLKVILTSGYSPDLAGEFGKQLNGHSFLAKPYNPKALARTVRDCLDGVSACHSESEPRA